MKLILGLSYLLLPSKHKIDGANSHAAIPQLFTHVEREKLWDSSMTTTLQSHKKQSNVRRTRRTTASDGIKATGVNGPLAVTVNSLPLKMLDGGRSQEGGFTQAFRHGVEGMSIPRILCQVHSGKRAAKASRGFGEVVILESRIRISLAQSATPLDGQTHGHRPSRRRPTDQDGNPDSENDVLQGYLH